MKHLKSNSVLGLSILASLVITLLYLKPFMTEMPYMYVSSKMIILASVVLLSSTLFISNLLHDLVQKNKLISFFTPIFVLTILMFFAKLFFFFIEVNKESRLVFFHSEFVLNLVAVVSLTLLFTTLYKLVNRQKAIKE